MTSPHTQTARPGPKFVCEHKGCFEEFSRRQEMERHMEENKKHAPPRHCPVTGCEYKVQRKSRLRDHLQKEHNWSPEESTNAVPLSSFEDSTGQDRHLTPPLASHPVTQNAKSSMITPTEWPESTPTQHNHFEYTSNPDNFNMGYLYEDTTPQSFHPPIVHQDGSWDAGQYEQEGGEYDENTFQTWPMDTSKYGNPNQSWHQ